MPITRHGWEQFAACQFADPELFFPVSESGPAITQIAQAKAICSACPVRRDCLAFALATPQAQGVWGGMSEHERLVAGRTWTNS
jgi:WhiB family redox-sensing transcriptional regulator